MALVEFYIKNYLENGAMVTTEKCFQTIPWTAGDPALLSPKVKASMGKSGSFDFSLYVDHPLYGAMQQYQTKMRVVFAGNTIFRGRVITIDKTFDRTRTFHCEGVLSYLLDSHQEGTEEKTRPTISVTAYMQNLLTQHNADVEDEKKIQLGEVPGQYSNSITAEQRVMIPSEQMNQQFGNTSWNSTMERLEDLLNLFGGYMRIREVNGVNYLDWLDKYYNANINAQPIAVASNLIDLGGTSELENLFTVVVPIGKDRGENVYIGDYWPVAHEGHAKVNYIEVPELAMQGLYTDAELNVDYHRKSDYQNAISKYGRIWKTVDFENANTPEKLFGYAKDWIKNNYMPDLTQWSVTAIDLVIPGESQTPLIVGDRVTLTHSEVSQEYGSYTIIEAEYDLYEMDKSRYTIGIPNQQINASYGVAQKQEAKGKSKGGVKSRKKREENKNDELTYEDVKSRLLNQYVNKTEFGKDILLDNPMAFLMHSERGIPLTKVQQAVNAAEIIPQLEFTKTSRDSELRAEALRRGVPPDDPQLLIDFTPKLKKQQQDWKNATAWNLSQNTDMTEQEINVLLNETAGESWLASLVDDNGNWSQKAIDQGWASGAKKGSAEIKEQAIRTRSILNGSQKTYNPYDGAKERGIFGNIDISDIFGTNSTPNETTDTVDKVINFFGGNTKFDLSESFSGLTDKVTQAFDLLGGVFTGGSEKETQGGTEAKTSFFDLLSDKAHIDGKDGKAGFGKDSLQKWQVYLNDTVTYTDNDGVTHTLPGFVSAQDFNLPEVPSFKTRFAYIETAYISIAYIDTLIANDAYIKSVTGEQIVAGTFIRAANGYFGDVSLIGNSGNGRISAKSYAYRNNDETTYLEQCFDSAQTRTEASSPGTIYLDLYRANGQRITVPFDIASTQYFIDAVEAAYQRGRQEGSGTVSISISNVRDSNTRPSGSVSASDITTLIKSTTKSYVLFQVNAGESEKTYYIAM